MSFFDRVKDLAKKNTTLTLRGFIESLGINYETYYSGRSRGTLPRADEALAIAQALGVTVEYLVTGEQPAKPDSEKLVRHAEALLDGLRKL